ncbi:hypothetical protein JDS99_29825 [Bacillus cereus group sp. N6]|uniref:hypothetical protein n=1 Tax=Bacillus cereus group sp. N6 TaxID=2794583 RepID=UPI0018F73220|nr:hypothetical protein [Bacillus cereus group sp. N6]MBJ8113722.1 hypothetical protein [Bacillus cereus group sp. N6]
MKGSKKIIISFFLIFTIFVTSVKNLQVAAATPNSVETGQKVDSTKQKNQINQTDLLKITQLLKHQEKIFKFYEKKIYPNGVSEEAHDQAIKTITNNIRNYSASSRKLF